MWVLDADPVTVPVCVADAVPVADPDADADVLADDVCVGDAVSVTDADRVGDTVGDTVGDGVNDAVIVPDEDADWVGVYVADLDVVGVDVSETVLVTEDVWVGDAVSLCVGVDDGVRDFDVESVGERVTVAVREGAVALTDDTKTATSTTNTLAQRAHGLVE